MKCVCPAPLPRLKHRVTIERPRTSAVRDAGGHINLKSNTTWEVVGTRAAQIITRGGSERMRFNQIAAEVDRIFVMRSDVMTRSIQAKWRLTFRQDNQIKIINITAAFDVNSERRIVEVHGTEIVD